MRKTASISLCLLALLAASAHATDFEQKWVYVSTNLMFEHNVDKLIRLIDRSAQVGVTHIQLNDYQFGFMADMPPVYFRNIARVRRAADSGGIIIAPGICGPGSAGRYLYNNPNLADGIPVRDMRFLVSGAVAAVDPSVTPEIVNAGLDDASVTSDETPLPSGAWAGWTVQDSPEGKPHVFVDRKVKHSGDSSVKFANLEDIPRSRGGRFGITRTVKVKPFHAYRLGVWIKTDGHRPERHPVTILGSRDKRMLCFSYFMQDTRQNWASTGEDLSPGIVVAEGDAGYAYVDFGIKPTQDWTLHKVAFNTLDYDEIDLSIGVSRANTGAIWFDDISLEPAGLLNVLRRDLTPLKVTSEDGAVVYQELVDFMRIEDPSLGLAPSRGDFMVSSRGTFDIWHDPPAIVLTPDSRIKDGQALLVSFYSPGIVYVKLQVALTLSDPAAFAVLNQEIKSVHSAWQSSCYFLNYDEIRSAGWEPQPQGARLSPGQLLAAHTAREIEIVKKYAPDATLCVWSDMYDPYHNARQLDQGDYYYLVNGSYAGAEDGLPSDVVICNWNGGRGKDSLAFFAGLGHKQIIAGYYDATTDERVTRGIDRWLTAAQDVPGIIGCEYTTWTGNYDWMSRFFTYLKEWKPAEAPPESGGPAPSSGAARRPTHREMGMPHTPFPRSLFVSLRGGAPAGLSRRYSCALPPGA